MKENFLQESEVDGLNQDLLYTRNCQGNRIASEPLVVETPSNSGYQNARWRLEEWREVDEETVKLLSILIVVSVMWRIRAWWRCVSTVDMVVIFNTSKIGLGEMRMGRKDENAQFQHVTVAVFSEVSKVYNTI